MLIIFKFWICFSFQLAAIIFFRPKLRPTDIFRLHYLLFSGIIFDFFHVHDLGCYGCQKGKAILDRLVNIFEISMGKTCRTWEHHESFMFWQFYLWHCFLINRWVNGFYFKQSNIFKIIVAFVRFYKNWSILSLYILMTQRSYLRSIWEHFCKKVFFDFAVHIRSKRFPHRGSCIFKRAFYSILL